MHDQSRLDVSGNSSPPTRLLRQNSDSHWNQGQNRVRIQVPKRPLSVRLQFYLDSWTTKSKLHFPSKMYHSWDSVANGHLVTGTGLPQSATSLENSTSCRVHFLISRLSFVRMVLCTLTRWCVRRDALRKKTKNKRKKTKNSAPL